MLYVQASSGVKLLGGSDALKGLGENSTLLRWRLAASFFVLEGGGVLKRAVAGVQGSGRSLKAARPHVLISIRSSLTILAWIRSLPRTISCLQGGVIAIVIVVVIIIAIPITKRGSGSDSM